LSFFLCFHDTDANTALVDCFLSFIVAGCHATSSGAMQLHPELLFILGCFLFSLFKPPFIAMDANTALVDCFFIVSGFRTTQLHPELLMKLLLVFFFY